MKAEQFGASGVVQRVKGLLVMLVSYVLVPVLASPHIELPVSVPGKQLDGPRTWVPTIHVKDLMEFLAPCFLLAQS